LLTGATSRCPDDLGTAYADPGDSGGVDAEHRDGQCRVQHSTDGGATWSEPLDLTPIERCGTVGIWSGPDGMVAVGARSISYDLGGTWQPIEQPAGAAITDVRASPGFDQDGVLLVGLTHGGVLALGPGAQPVQGHQACKAPPVETLAPFFETVDWLLDRLGCATGVEQRARYLEKQSVVNGRPARLIWVRGAPAALLVLYTNPRPDGTYGWFYPLPAIAEPDAPDREVTIVRQGFENGKAWIVLDQDERPAEILFISGDGFSGEYRSLEPTR
jgi:hypothetical protein